MLPSMPAPCIVDDPKGHSSSDVRRRGMCVRHYTRWKRYRDPLASKYDRQGPSSCIVEDPDGHSDGALVKGMCNRHYIRASRHGDPLHLPLEHVVPPCIVDDPAGHSRGNNRDVRALGMCMRHYKRHEAYGDPLHQAKADSTCVLYLFEFRDRGVVKVGISSLRAGQKPSSAGRVKQHQSDGGELLDLVVGPRGAMYDAEQRILDELDAWRRPPSTPLTYLGDTECLDPAAPIGDLVDWLPAASGVVS